MNEGYTRDNKRIAKNTVILYLRSFFVMCINVYLSRILLINLGVEDYGIYNVVGGVVAMFSMLSATFVSASQRFISYALGVNDLNKVRETFSISLKIHCYLGFFLFFVMELVGTWYLNNYVNMPSEREYAANWVYQFSVFTFMANLIIIPYNSLIIAKERMDIFAYVSIYEAVIKMIIVLSIVYSTIDSLIFYALHLFVLSLSIVFFYIILCSKKFEESHLVKIKDKALYKEFIKFSGWNFFGSCASILSTQGINLIINFFCGVTANAAKGIASQIEHSVTVLVQNFLIAMNPQITKSYSTGEIYHTKQLVYSGSKLGYYMTLVLSLPLLLSTDDILAVWLKNVPQYSKQFVQLLLVYILMIPLSSTLDKALAATGRIKNNQILTSIIQCINMPIAITLLYLKMPPYSVYFSFIFISWINLFVRIFNTSKNLESITIKSYILEVLFPIIITSSISTVLPIFYKIVYYTSSLTSWLILVFLIETSLLITIYVIGLNRVEKNFIKKIIKTKIYN